MKDISWDKLELIIFDVDGTLYDQSKLRKKMFFALIRYYIIRPWKYNDLLILYYFRKEREAHAGLKVDNLEEAQYEWCAKQLNCSIAEVKRVVEHWIFNFPNPYLASCKYAGLNAFFKELERLKIARAVYSDYDAAQKLSHMNIQVDLMVSSTQPGINSLKPLPNGLNYILSEMKIKDKRNCLFIGDRMELDGICADAAGIPFLLVRKQNAGFYEDLAISIKKSKL
ncbi:HAD family hydrolase [Pedobacter gandavensis]|uniref:HAD family hydrolase n=1 Tax=Pedobacter gandavensis TaxID=2679963 RepID=UPI001600F27C|nr:HAD family hydrolase [Pedobacter gandavensis]